MPYKEAPSQRLAFERVRRASVQYASNLRKVALHIGHLVQGFNPLDEVEMANLQMLLFRYAQTLAPWAKAQAARMLTEIGRRDTRAWEQYSRQMGMAMREELVSSSTGVVLRAALARQVDLITSLPTVAAQRVHDLTVENLAKSKRPAQIAEEIMKTGQVTKSRATLIARTEVARTASELTEARAVAVGSTHYIWRGVRDKRERDSHWYMEGRYANGRTPRK